MEFHTNFEYDGEIVKGSVGGIELQFNNEELGMLIDVPSRGFHKYMKKNWLTIDDDIDTGVRVTRKFAQQVELDTPQKRRIR